MSHLKTNQFSISISINELLQKKLIFRKYTSTDKLIRFQNGRLKCETEIKISDNFIVNV